MTVPTNMQDAFSVFTTMKVILHRDYAAITTVMVALTTFSVTAQRVAFAVTLVRTVMHRDHAAITVVIVALTNGQTTL